MRQTEGTKTMADRIEITNEITNIEALALIEEYTPYIDAIESAIRTDGYVTAIDDYMTECGIRVIIIEEEEKIQGIEIDPNGVISIIFDNRDICITREIGVGIEIKAAE